MVSKNLETINVAVTSLRQAEKAMRNAYKEVEKLRQLDELSLDIRADVELASIDLADLLYLADLLARDLDAEAVRLDELEG